MAIFLTILKVVAITLGVAAALIVFGILIIFAIATSGGRNPFQ